MRRFLLCLLPSVVWVTSVPCRAQEDAAPMPAPAAETQAEAQFDFRVRVPGSGKVSSLLHTTQVSLRTNQFLGPSLHVNLLGLDQYGALRWQQAALEAEFPTHLMSGDRLPDRVQAGIIRLPFGVYDCRETYSSGLIDYPMPRVDYAYASLDWGVPGIQWTGGTSRLQVEAAGFNGDAYGVWGNLNRVGGGALRVQTFLPPDLILGFSGWTGNLEAIPGRPFRSDVHIGGIDVRYTRSHLVLRGEAIAGSVTGNKTRGAYLDAYYRLPGLEKLTAVARGEFLKPSAVEPEARQFTTGIRWTPSADWTLAANWQRNNIARAYKFTWTPPAGGRGDLLFQVQRRFSAP